MQKVSTAIWKYKKTAPMLYKQCWSYLVHIQVSGTLFAEMCRNMLYMLVPYLSSATGGFAILRKFPSREGVYFSSAFGAVISIINLKGVYSYSWIYSARYIGHAF